MNLLLVDLYKLNRNGAEIALDGDNKVALISYPGTKIRGYISIKRAAEAAKIKTVK